MVRKKTFDEIVGPTQPPNEEVERHGPKRRPDDENALGFSGTLIPDIRLVDGDTLNGHISTSVPDIRLVDEDTLTRYISTSIPDINMRG